MAKKGSSSWTKAEMERLAQLAGHKGLTLNGLVESLGITKYKLPTGLLPLYRQAVERIEYLESQLPEPTESLEPTATDIVLDERGRAGVPEAKSDSTISAQGPDSLVPPEDTGDTAHPNALHTEGEDRNMAAEKEYDDRITEHAAQLARLTGEVERAVGDLKEVATATKETVKGQEKALQNGQKTQADVERLASDVNSLQRAIEDQGQAGIKLGEELSVASQRIEDQDGKLQKAVLEPQQLDSAMAACMEQGGKFCELVSMQMQDLARKTGVTEGGGHDHAGAEEFWSCPDCSKALTSALQSDSFDEIRQSIARTVPEKDIPVLLERLQEAGMKVVEETNSIFLPQVKTE